MLCGISAWGLLFLAVFIYFTDSNPAEPAPSPLSFLETLRLPPLQGKQRAIMGAAHEPAPRGGPAGPAHAAPAERQEAARAPAGAGEEDALFSRVGRRSQRAFPPEDDGSFFPRGPPRRPGRPSPRARAGSGVPAQRRPRQPGRGRASLSPAGPLPGALLRRLWTGEASARMLSPRLQRAMRDYVRANKHGVRFRGRRAARRAPAELLCALRRARPRTVDGTEPPFAALGWRGLVPATALSQLHPRGLRSCAVVMSAGAILNSSLGAEIGGCPGGAGLRATSVPGESGRRCGPQGCFWPPGPQTPGAELRPSEAARQTGAASGGGSL